MKLKKKILSLLLSCTFALTTVPSVGFAADKAESSSIYDTTISAESKEAESSSQFNVFDIYDAHQDYLAEHPEYTAPSVYRDCLGIDVSQWNGDIDWAAVKASGVDYVIIRAGYGKYAFQVDKKFYENIRGAQAVGLDCGVYWYSYALTVEDARREAEVCCEIINGYDYTFPVYFDIEEKSQQALSTAQASAIIETFCSTIADNGYHPGLYSYASFLNTQVYKEVLEKYDVWVAHFNVAAPSYSNPYGMWQYSSTGTVPGIKGDVDLDHCYKNYPYIISPESYTGPGGSDTTTSTTTTTVTIDKGIAQGIDVSFWQNEIDWDRVAADGIDYAIIRAGYGRYASQFDLRFEENAERAHNAGIDIGIYWYSYADSPEAAVQEAEACYEVIKDYKYEYPVYFDIEDPSISNKSAEELTAITDAFCSTLQDKGYYVGITSYSNFLAYKLLPEIYDKYDVWVAHYGVKKPSFSSDYGMWQYSSDSTVDGISTRVDMDYCYIAYPEIMKAHDLNGFGVTPSGETQETVESSEDNTAEE